MVALPRFQGPSPRIASIGGAACAVLVAVIVVLTPTDILENLVWTSGIAALVPAAQPPLGLTAHAVLDIAAGGLAGTVGWSVLYLLVGPGGFLVGERQERVVAIDAPPVVRRADAHPDAPPRRPISAADLGMPPMDARPIERELPKDLEQPLAAFDPAAIPDAPLVPVRAVAPLSRPQPAPPRPGPAAPPSIEALLRRLEQGARHASPRSERFAAVPSSDTGR